MNDVFEIYYRINALSAPPKILPFSFGTDPLNSGQPYTVTCSVVGGDKPLTTKWLHNGLELTPAIGAMNIVPLGDSGSLLAITAVRPEHAGNYTCTVENKAGVVTHTAELNVAGKE